LPTAWRLANRGYTVMVVSLPGYGLSSGQADLAGTRSIAALELALDRLRRSEGVDSTRIGVWGISQGATAALQLAARRRDLKGVFAQAGLYDLAAIERTTTSDDMRRLLADEAGSRGSWKRRSPMASVERIKVPVMLLHGEKDEMAPPGQANDFVTQLKAAGQNATLRLIAGQGHWINPITARDAADDFFEAPLSPVRRSRQ
jgi:dipeptidyl aminopeptidase/acylaminoacyl peptidase